MVVDDEPGVRQVLRLCLEGAGYRVLEAASETQLREALAREPIDLVTLDLGLDGEDGLDLTQGIRACRNVPIVMISGRGDAEDRIAGLERGADDYIAKPFHLREVTLRIGSVLARYARPLASPEDAPAKLAFEGYVLDPFARELYRSDGARVDLTETEFRLIDLFARNAGRVLSRDELWRVLRGREHMPLDRTLDGHVARLRGKLAAPDDEQARLIKSVRGVGYVFAADVRTA